MYFDFHTHNPNVGPSGIYNFRIGKDKEIPRGDRLFSAGIHPWDVEDVSLNNAFDDLESLLNHKNCLGLGEVGLDKHFGTKLELQLDVLRKQIEIANRSSKKVLIIHCVKAYQEILAEKKDSDIQLSWVLHGFNGSIELINSLSQAGFYFSVGELLLRPESKISKALIQVPFDRLFLETDDSSYSIEQIYLKASKIIGLGINELQNQIQGNLKDLFPSLNG